MMKKRVHTSRVNALSFSGLNVKQPLAVPGENV